MWECRWHYARYTLKSPMCKKSLPNLLLELQSAIAVLTKSVSVCRLIMLPCQTLADLFLFLFFSSGPAPSPSSFLPSPSPQPSQSPAAARTPQNFSVPSPGPLNTPGECDIYIADHELVYILITDFLGIITVFIWHDINIKQLCWTASIANSGHVVCIMVLFSIPIVWSSFWCCELTCWLLLPVLCALQIRKHGLKENCSKFCVLI